MKIIIKSVESGWDTERVMELPEDEAKIIRIHRTISGPKGHIRILLDVAKSLGLELVKIKRE